jgi:uncharacterized protein (TIGR03067 family)
MKTVTILCAVSLLADPPNSDRDLIQGTWKFVSYEAGGVVYPAGAFRVSIKADTLTWELMGQPVKFKLQLDATKRPKELTMLREDQRMPVLAIYSLVGDELKMCYGTFTSRPTKFDSQDKQAAGFWILKRVRE